MTLTTDRQVYAELALRTFRRLVEIREAEITSLPDYKQRLEERGSRGFHTDLDMALDLLDQDAYRRGFFFWEDEDLDATIEEIRPTEMFDAEVATARYHELYQSIPPGRAPLRAEIYSGMREIEHEALRNGFELQWDRATQRNVFRKPASHLTT